MSVPKIFIAPCIITVPIPTRDIISPIETPVAYISPASLKLKRKSLFDGIRNLCFLMMYITQSTTEIPCAIRVAYAAPSTPILKPRIKRRSSPILAIVDIIRKISGETVSPTARRTPAQML